MRPRFLPPLLGVLLLAALEGAALAQTAPAPAPTTAPAPAAAPAPAPAPAAAGTAAAPAGATPAPAARPAAPSAGTYGGLISKGDSAYLARDYEGAIAAYKEELSKNTSSALAHYRLGEAALAKGDTAQAEQSFQNALRFAGKDEKIRGKTLFLLADLKERMKAYDDAIQRWKDYSAQAQAQPETKGYPASAAERVKRCEEWKKISADSALVKERIEKRVKEAEEALKKSSK